MLLINDCIINEVDSSFKINSIDYLCKHGNMKKLAKMLNLKTIITACDYYTVYLEDKTQAYVIYNASVDDALLNLLEESFCNDEEIKKISLYNQYTLDRTSIRMEHLTIRTWDHSMRRYHVLRNKLIVPMTRVRLVAFVKYLNTMALRFKKWKKKLLLSKETSFKAFDVISFEEILALVSGSSSPTYAKLYDEEHLKIKMEVFREMSDEDKLKAMSELLYSYVINEYVIRSKDRKYSPKQLEDFFKEVCMIMVCRGPLNFKFYIERNYTKLVANFDHMFYSLFKSYEKYIGD